MNENSVMPPAMILCGGRGTRLRDVTELLPKPMVPIGEQPILWHIMHIYAAFGVRRFILCLGYKRECFIDYFMNFHAYRSDVTITLGSDANRVRFHDNIPEEGWEVTLADTGIDTMTGGRVAIAAKYLRPEEEEFFLTYGDGVADVDLAALLALHRRRGKLLTVSAVHPEGRFGEMQLTGESVAGFEEKPVHACGFINGGFMVMKRKFVTRYLTGEDAFLEQRPMYDAVKAGDIAAYRHESFWQCMDTPREYALLNHLWETGRAPWTKFWKHA